MLRSYGSAALVGLVALAERRSGELLDAFRRFGSDTLRWTEGGKAVFVAAPSTPGARLGYYNLKVRTVYCIFGTKAYARLPARQCAARWKVCALTRSV